MDMSDSKYEPSVKSPNNNTKTGSPGEKSAISHSPSRATTYEAQCKLENRNYSDPVKMTGKLSAPMPEKGSMKLVGTGIHTSTDGKGAKGEVKENADPMAYLGHFRSSKVLECGHNQGAPGGTLPTVETGGGFSTPPAGLTGVSIPAGGRLRQTEPAGGFATPAAPSVGAVRSAVSPRMAKGMLSPKPGRALASNVGGMAATQQDVRMARPVVAARADKRAAVQEAKSEGAPRSTIRGIRQAGRANVQAAKKTVRAAKKARLY